MGCVQCGAGRLVEGPTLVELVYKDFGRARWRQRFGWWVRRLKREALADRLACFAGERARRTVFGRGSPELRTVELAEIGGSVGRCQDFDRDFLPVCSCLGERWRRVDRAFREGRQLPPVRLYRLGGRYFVADGNHRVSVARYRNLPMIEAEVTELLEEPGRW